MPHRPGLIRSIPFALYVGLLILDPHVKDLLPSGVDGRWLYGLRVGFVLLALAVLWRHFSELREDTAADRRTWLLAVGIGALVFFLWVKLDFKPLAFSPGEGFDPRVGGRIDLGLAAVRLAGATLVVPVMEELFWRSFILRWLHNPAFLSVPGGDVGMRALLLSSALFASEHTLWFAGFLAGMAYGWLYKRTGSLWAPIGAHAVTNGLLGAYVLATGSWTFW